MKQSQEHPPFPVEFGLIAGLALASSGQLPVLILSTISWLFLRHFRPHTPILILLITSMILGKTFLAGIAMFFVHTPPLLIIEIIGVLIISLFFFFTHRLRWAYLILIHDVYVVVSLSINISQRAISERFEYIAFGAIAIHAMTVWLLILFIRTPSSAPIVASNSPIGKNEKNPPADISRCHTSASDKRPHTPDVPPSVISGP